MKVLIVSPRWPFRGGKGDQLRAYELAEALAAEHEIALLTGAQGPAGDDAIRRHASVEVLRAALPVRALGALGALLRAQPGQIGWMTPGPVWRRVREAARGADVVIAITSRSVRGALPAPVVIDHIDALSLNLVRRADGAEPLPVRLAARFEAAAMRRWERSLTELAVAQMAVSQADADALPSPPQVIVLGLRGDSSAPPPGPGAERPVDVVLTGNMRYGPNVDAARWLEREIAPALLRERPGTSIVVAGRDARTLRLGAGIEVRSDVPDMHALLSSAKVAIAPLRIGTGSPIKVLEAIAARAAVVGTPEALSAIELPHDAAVSATDAERIAKEVAALLDDAPRRAAMTARALEVSARFGIDAQREVLRTILAAAVRSRG